MEPVMDPNTRRFLHIANGTSTTDTIHAAGIPGSTSIWADPLHEGPVPARLTDEELLDVRARHLAGNDRSGVALAETIAELKRWRQAIDDRASYDDLVLWYEHDLFDQLNLIQLLTRIGQEPAVDHRRVSLICIDRFPGHPRFKGLGELSALELESLLETRQPVSAGQYELAARAWDAFRADDPLALDQLLETDTSALPFLASSLRRHLEEFPWTRDGLSRTERRIMQLARPGSIDIRRAFQLMHDDESAFYIGDSSFWQIVTELESATPALVSVAATEAGPGRLPSGTIALTDAGRSILGGHADRISQCGIDRWLGGVHLVEAQPNWRWDPERGRIAQL
jgi:hypothetical protein